MLVQVLRLVLCCPDIMCCLPLTLCTCFCQPSAAFVAAWQGCTPETAVKHLDVEAPGLFQRLYRREVSGTWEGQTVACSAAGARGGFEVGNYWSWKGWRDGLSGVQPLGEVG